jgi:hypothetical protein
MVSDEWRYIMALMNTNTLSYDMAGRKRKRHQPRGDVYTKYKPIWAPYVSSPGPVRRDEGEVYKSADMTMAGPCVAPEKKQYTGTLVKGISTMHKSNAVPVIDDQEIIDHARMRR